MIGSYSLHCPPTEPRSPSAQNACGIFKCAITVAEGEIPSRGGGLLFLSDLAGPLRQKPMEISVAIWGGAMASTRGIAEHA